MRLWPRNNDDHVKASEKFCQQGDAAMARNDPGAALPFYMQAIEGTPTAVHALMGAASAQRALGKWAEAIDMVDRVLALEPEHFEARYLRALVFMEGKHYDAALHAFRACLDDDAARSSGYLSEIRTHIERLEQAISIEQASAETKIIRD